MKTKGSFMLSSPHWGTAESPGWRKAGGLPAPTVRALVMGQTQFRESMRGPNTTAGQGRILPKQPPSVPGELAYKGSPPN